MALGLVFAPAEAGAVLQVSGDLVELSMRVAVPNDGPRLATPRVLTPLDRKVVIEARSPDSPRYRISVIASSHPIGTTLPPVR